MRIEQSAFVCAVVALSGVASGAVNGFSEDFAVDGAAWRQADAVTPVVFQAGGGPDGAGDTFVQAPANFVNNGGTDTPVVFRAEDAWGSSGGALFGDYLSAGIDEVSFSVRHFLPEPANFFIRLAQQPGQPAASAIEFVPVAPGVWTEITLDISFGSSSLFLETGNPSQAFYDALFGDVQRIQLGLFGVPASVAGQDQAYTFDLDDVGLAPTPGALGVLALGGVAALRRRRG